MTTNADGGRAGRDALPVPHDGDAVDVPARARDVGVSDEGMLFIERDGLVVIEAESYVRAEREEERSWVRFDDAEWPEVGPDPDPPHVDGASKRAYLEILPDLRVLEGESAPGSFHEVGETGPRLTFPVRFETAGAWILWVRAYSTGTEDNGVHMGIDDSFPSESERIQWCAGKNEWTWSSARRNTSGTCGRPRTATIEVPSPGVHDIHVAMREDGFELDKVILARDPTFSPSGVGPAETLVP